MTLGKSLIRILSVVIFIIGVVVGLFVFGVAVWADFEATMFDSLINEKGTVRISCPVVINDSETGEVNLTISNRTDEPIKNRIWTKITEGAISLIDESRERYDVAPGEDIELSWTVYPDGAVYNGRLILVKIRTDPTYPLINRQGSCGILVISETNLSGNQFLITVVSISIIFMATGIIIWWLVNKPIRGKNYRVYRAMLALGIIVILGLLFGLLGYWSIGAILLILTILVIGAMIAYFLMT